ncbi:GNAT family N-acetyltransferase [Prosthecomicrobium pneumaticum]|uniref:RimJ/RimL family protein N-acetyltransferase n=1 Tax=Prosthecomicrobium pneumaticum TaxID=81895 RepID=A0A7W9L2G7_9HYPH|nr:GNAT family N-acetyltransferase [Prosthecomicrobium pneumaticum]MBB5753486.1 RimJ/RimL family protein N-acetyltransferase [Prosthecomicrobium pneumaticum]
MQDDGAAALDTEDEERSILTQRLALRAPQAGDAAALAAALDNPRVATSLVGVPYPFLMSDAEAFIRRERAHRKGPGACFLAIRRSCGHVVGAGSYRPSGDRPDGYDLTFWVAEHYWGRGYGTEIAHRIVDDAFSNGSMDRLWTVVRVTNGRARRVVEKCGFQFRGSGMVSSIATRGAVAVERFVLERSVWTSIKEWGAGRFAASDDDDAESDAA